MIDADAEKLESSVAVDETLATESLPAQTRTGYILPLIYIFLVSVILVDVFYLITYDPETAILRPARETLRSIGSAQLAYQSSNNDKLYGSLEALQSIGKWPQGATHTTIIKHYSLSWVANPPYSPLRTHTLGGFGMRAFTIIAWPDRQRIFNTDLRTYAITEDQMLRQFEPTHGNKLNAVHTWDPVIEP